MRRIAQQAISNEPCEILDTGKPSFTPKKGKTSVVMFGPEKRLPLQNMPIITRRRKKEWKPVLVCADTFRAGAFEQLKQNAAKAKTPFHGRSCENCCGRSGIGFKK